MKEGRPGKETASSRSRIRNMRRMLCRDPLEYEDLIRSSYDIGDCKCVKYIEEDTLVLVKNKSSYKS